MRETRISPGWMSRSESASSTTRATPSTCPGEAAMPARPPSLSPPLSHAETRSEVIP